MTVPQTPRILWLIPARSGSKGIAHKNIHRVGGLPLLAWKIIVAKSLPGTVWLSTDSADYASLGVQFGAEIPFMRPAHLASDTASSDAVCLHAMEYAAHCGLHFDIIVLLQVTSPFVRRKSLCAALDKLIVHPEARALVATCPAPVSSLIMQEESLTLDEIIHKLAVHNDLRRQALPHEICLCGAFDMVRWNSYLETKTVYAPTVIPWLLEDPIEYLDIDSPLQMDFAQFLVEKGKVTQEWLLSE